MDISERDRSERRECPVAIIQQDGDRARGRIRHGQVNPAVSREVARRDRARAAGHGDRREGLEGPVTVVQENRDRAESSPAGSTSSDVSVTAKSVRPSPLKSAATIDVGVAPRRQWDGHGLLERAVAIARQDR